MTVNFYKGLVIRSFKINYVTLTYFLPTIKPIPQFLIKGELFIAMQRGGGRYKNRQSPIFVMFSLIALPFGSTLDLIAIPRPTASGLQFGGRSRENRRVLFFYKRKK